VLALLPLLSILIAPPRTEIVSGRADLAKACSSGLWIHGCTKFLGEKLECACELEGSRWRLRAHAQFIPYMYLWQPTAIAHENLHIADIREWLNEYLSKLESTTYGSASDCLRDANTEASGFNKRMDEWKRASNAKRHPTQSVAGRK
jgi:hypothetical protein